MFDRPPDNEMNAEPNPNCLLCGATGRPLYHGLRDQLFSAPGKWDVKQCPRAACGLLWLDPMPLERDIGKAYQDYYTHKQIPAQCNTILRQVERFIKRGYLAHKYGYYGQSLTAWNRLLGSFIYLHPRRRTDFDFNVMYLSAQAHGRLLEVGCGNGSMLKSMQDLGWEVQGVDRDPRAVQYAKEQGLNVGLGTLETQAKKANDFDAVIMSHVIEHVHNPLSLLIECHRILKECGRLVLVTPNGKSWGHKLFHEAWRGLEPPRHLHVFTPSALQALAEKAGFQKPSVSTTIRDANELFIASQALRSSGTSAITSRPRGLRMKARVMQVMEWMMLKVKPDIGEEIVLNGRK
jgi:2-polyprenyl-3-methyl-5-hydroxy-6-metoxy-1,4-benzoquinol methylase